MPENHFGNVNLNLLRTLRAVLKYCSVTKAANELHLTQAAVSNNLRKLREHFDDELLTRDGRNLRLTPKAETLIGPLEATFVSLQQLFITDTFDPARCTQRFRIAAASNTAAILMPALATVMEQEAPDVSLQFVTATATSPQDLRNNKIDLIISPREVAVAVGLDPADPAKGISAEDLPPEAFVCLVSEHAEVFRNGITKEIYLNNPHASFFLSLDHAGSIEQRFIESMRIGQFDRMLTSDFTILPMIAAASNLIVLVPESLAKIAVRALPLRIYPCPIPIPNLELWSIWNRSRDNNDGLIWLRDMVRRGFHLASQSVA